MPSGPPSPDDPSAHAGVAVKHLPSHGLLAATTLLKRLFMTFEGHLAMQLWNGDPLRLGRAAPLNVSPPFTLVIRNPGAISAMVPGFDRLRFAEAYFRGDVDIEGDFFAALGLKAAVLVPASDLRSLGLLFGLVRILGLGLGHMSRLE